MFSWLMLGWLFPTLMLLPDRAGPGRRRRQARAPAEQPRAAGRGRLAAAAAGISGLGATLEAWLHQLQFPAWQGQQQMGGDGEEWAAAPEEGEEVMCVLRWWVLVAVAWGACCTTAPLFVPAGADGSGGVA